MNAWPIVATAIAIILVLVGVILIYVVRKRKKEGVYQEPDYRVFFILGFMWFPLGVVFLVRGSPFGYVYFVIGLVYITIGLAHRDKWKKT